MKKNVLIYGAGSKARIISKVLDNYRTETNRKFLYKDHKKIFNPVVKYLFDPTIRKIHFKSKGQFSNKTKDLKKFISNSDLFIVCIGAENGKARTLISKKFEKFGLRPISVVSNFSYIDSTAIIGKGSHVMPNAVVHSFTKIGDYCILNTNSTIDHECTIGNGVHIMGGANVAGKVIIGNYVSVGTNATILPYIKIEEGAYIGAGAVVTKNVKKNQVVVGVPAKFIKYNKIKSQWKKFKLV